MKISPSTNYWVSVRPEQWDVDSPNARHFTGIFQVLLNFAVTVAFVPDITAIPRPWDFAALPEFFDDAETVQQARLSSLLQAGYTVTPDDARAGTAEPFDWSDPTRRDYHGVVRYVTATDFARYTAELEQLSDVVGGIRPRKRVGELRTYDVVGFIEREIVASPWLRPEDAAELGQPSRPV